jgi:uncharacterized protein (TIGR03067 family)
MQRRTSVMWWLIISTGLVLACALPAEAAETTLQGTWIATKAEQDGKAADDLVGHRLSFMGNRFEIRSKEDKPLYAGTVQINPSTKPATIDFQQNKGGPKGEGLEGNLCCGRRHADNLRQRAEPEEGPACRVRGKKRVRVCPHYVQARKASRHLNLLYLNGRDLRRALGIKNSTPST